ncbi:PepSY-associated TM helix domain-containing protein [Nocardioides sp. NPDC058538]|uniref:PepSY-associated TM helix domain-containing protein n=1 Tax=Nocardioides sp. NPDC058538 TaxID=3346542 RepID=UPI003664BB6D
MTTIPTEPSQPRAGVGTPDRKRSSALLWLLARRVHFMAGLLVAPFLAVLALTGLAYAFTPQINDVLYGDKLYVESQTGSPRPLSEQVEAALAVHPDAHVTTVIPADDPDRTAQVVLAGIEGLKQTGSHFSSESLTVYVDPYTGGVNGELVTVDSRPPAQVWLRELHGNLHLGDLGRLYSEFVASWLPFIVLGGLVLWLSKRARGRSLRTVLVPSFTAKGRARNRSWHGVLGLWLAVGLLGISITGLTWSNFAGARVDAAITALNGKTPSLATPDVAAADGAEPISFDRAVEVARSEGLQGELTLALPHAGEGPVTVKESSEGLPIRKTSVVIDPYTEQVTARQGWEDYPLMAKLTSIGISAHSGTLFGLANQLALALLAVGSLALLGLGYRMWWQRRPIRSGRTSPVPVWRNLSAPMLVVVLLAAGALGWAMPVFGVTLVAFVVLDGAVNTLRRRRTRVGAV